MVGEALEIFARFGLPGLVIFLQFVWIWRQEKRITHLTTICQKESAARVADAQQYASLAVDLQERVFGAVEAINDRMAQEERHIDTIARLVDVLRGERQSYPEIEMGEQ